MTNSARIDIARLEELEMTKDHRAWTSLSNNGKNMNLSLCTQQPICRQKKNGIYKKSAPRIIFLCSPMVLYTQKAPETAKKVAVLLKSTTRP